MKNGVVRNGKTTTLYGSHASMWLAEASARFCLSQEEANDKVRASSPTMRGAYVEALGRYGFTFDPEWVESLNVEDARKEEEVRALLRQKAALRYQKRPVETKTTSSKCNFCFDRISKGSPYHDGGRGHRVHVACVEKILSQAKAD